MPKHLKITIDGRTQNLRQWCVELGIPYKTVHSRIQNGWTTEKALMPATNRKGVEREKDDFYPTPDWLIDAILPEVFENMGDCLRVLEPAVGDGAIVWRIHNYAENIQSPLIHQVDCVDIAKRIDVERSTPEFGNTAFYHMSFFDYARQRLKNTYDVIITNPPYSLAQQYVEHGLQQLKPGGKLVLLLRLNFFGAQKRAKWHRKHMPEEVWVTPKRPSFRGKGSDATEYAWFVWGFTGAENSKLRLLHTELDKYKSVRGAC